MTEATWLVGTRTALLVELPGRPDTAEHPDGLAALAQRVREPCGILGAHGA